MSTDQGFLPPTQDDPFGRGAGSAQAGEHAGGTTGAQLAGFWQRAGGSLIDGLIVGAATWVLTLLVAAIAGDTGAGVSYLLLVVASLFYAPLLMARGGEHNGQTWGKQAVGVRVVRERGGAMTFGTGAVRELVGKTLLGIVVLPTLASIVMVAARADKKAIWDLLAGTRVVRG